MRIGDLVKVNRKQYGLQTPWLGLVVRRDEVLNAPHWMINPCGLPNGHLMLVKENHAEVVNETR